MPGQVFFTLSTFLGWVEPDAIVHVCIRCCSVQYGGIAYQAARPGNDTG